MAIAAIIAAAQAEAAAAALLAAKTAAAATAATTTAAAAPTVAASLPGIINTAGSMTGSGAGLAATATPEALALQAATTGSGLPGIMGGQGALAPVEGIMQGAQAAAPIVESAGITQAAPNLAGQQQVLDTFTQAAADPSLMPQVGSELAGPAPYVPGPSTPVDPALNKGIFSTPTTPSSPVDLTQASGLHSGMDPAEIMRQQGLSRGYTRSEIIPQGGSAEAGAGSMKMGLEAGFEKALSFAKDNPMMTISGLQLLDRALAPGQPKRRAFNPGMSLSPNFKPTLAPSAPSGAYGRRMAEGGIAGNAEQPDYEGNVARYAQGGIAGYATGGTTTTKSLPNASATVEKALGLAPGTATIQQVMAADKAYKAGEPITAATIKANTTAAPVPAKALTVAPSTAPVATVNVPTAAPAATTVSPVAAAAAKQVAQTNPLMAAQTNPLMAAQANMAPSGFNAMNYISASGEGIPWYQQTANVNLPDAKKAAVIAGVTPGVAIKSQAEIDAAKPKTFDPMNTPFSAMNYTDASGAAIPWYQQPSVANTPDAKKAAVIAGVTPGTSTPSVAETQFNEGITATTKPTTKPTTATTIPATAEEESAATTGGVFGGPSSREESMEAMRRSVYVPEYVDYTRTPLTPGIGTPTTLSYEAIQSQLGHAPTLKEIGTASAAYEAAKPTTAAQYTAMSEKGEKGMAKGGKTSGNLFRSIAESEDQPTLEEMEAVSAHLRNIGQLAEDDDVDTRLLDPYSAAQVRLAKLSKKHKMAMAPAAKTNVDPANMAQGGITQNLGSYSDGGHLLKGPGDGMSDHIPAMIGKHQPARLADGEFVIPADVVSHLGNGSTEAGAKQLYAMMSRIREARTGNPKQGKQVNPRKLMPK